MPVFFVGAYFLFLATQKWKEFQVKNTAGASYPVKESPYPADQVAGKSNSGQSTTIEPALT